MKACVWYGVDEKLPPQNGYYLAFRGMSMGDNTTAVDYFYYNTRTKEWRDGTHSTSYWVNVCYWTEADPANWYDKYRIVQRRNEMSTAEQDAWTAVQHAIEQYEIVRQLAKV